MQRLLRHGEPHKVMAGTSTAEDVYAHATLPKLFPSHSPQEDWLLSAVVCCCVISHRDCLASQIQAAFS